MDSGSISVRNWIDLVILFSVMRRGKPDRRKIKTIASLRTALIELILEKHYDSITVQDIIDRADVGRSTFYTHFRDKEDLFIGDWKKFLGLIAAHIDLDSASTSGNIAPLHGLMMHVKDYHPLYRALVKSGKTERLFSVGIDYLEEKIKARILASEQGLSVPPEIVAHFLSLQIFGMLKWWLDRNMSYSPGEMGKMFQSLVAPGIANVLGKPENEGSFSGETRAYGMHK